MEPKLSDYGLIGNCRGSALVSRFGSIDWCCLPEFDSPSIFAALLDRQKGGCFSIHPVQKYQSAQQYLPATNVVATQFITGEGEVRLTDAFVAMTEEEKATLLFPDHEILRIVEGVKGAVKLKMHYAPRNFYGASLPVLEDHERLGIRFTCRENVYTLLTTLDPRQVRVTDNKTDAVAEFEITSNQRVVFSLSHCSQSPAVLPELKMTGTDRMEKTISFWKAWTRQSNYAGLYAGQVQRSALTLKLLAYAPSGAIIAGPTTSLPEEPGGERNWDYRFCWLRDASFTTRVLLSLGFEHETHAYMKWILHATALTRPKLQVVYSVFGEANLKEKILPWLAGYRNSKPVRVGNDADRQFQLDVYGEVLDAAFSYSTLVKEFDLETKKFLIGLGKTICQTWNKPDNGIWEVRSALVHHTHSKVMAWVGLDRLLKLCRAYHWNNAPLKRFEETAEMIRAEIERYGYSHLLKSYTRELNGNSVDASALTFSLVCYSEATSDRMIATTARIQQDLSENGLVFRYRNTNDGLAGREGAFGVCTFWLAENLAKAGRLKEAIHVFETMLKRASPTGLFSEEIDPGSNDLLGNYPQGFTHIGLINAAITINQVYENTSRKEKTGERV